MVMLYLFITLLSLVITYYIWKNRGLPPGPWGLPIIGYLPWLNPGAPYLSLTELSRKYGEIYGLRMGNVYTVVLTNPKTIKTVFSKEATTGRAPLYLTHGIMKGYGLICAEGELWKEQRKFAHNCLKQLGGSKIGPQRTKMESLIKDHVSDFFNGIEEIGLNIAIDPLKPLRHSLGSIINKVVFGKCWSRDDETWKWLQHMQEEGTKYIGIAGPLNFLPFMRFIPKYKQTMRFLIEGKNKTHVLYQQLIDEQIALLENNKEVAISNVIQAFLLERKRKGEITEKFYNDQQFYHLLADVFGASLDTTLTTLRWYFLFLAKNKVIQANIRTEIQEVLHDRAPSIDDMSHLPLVEASICEVQRIRSVVPVGIPHGSTEELTIDGYRIPSGTMFVPLQWALHMNENVWIDPETFNPSRFIDDEGKVQKFDYFMPFQVGKRMCVGDELARMLLFLFGATTIQSYSISLDDEERTDLSGECGITLTPKPHKLIFCKI